MKVRIPLRYCLVILILAVFFSGNGCALQRWSPITADLETRGKLTEQVTVRAVAGTEAAVPENDLFGDSSQLTYEFTEQSTQRNQPTANVKEDVTFVKMLDTQWEGICADHAEFYSPTGLTWLTIGLGSGALMANTGFDNYFLRDSYIDSIVLAPSDELYEALHEPKVLGNGLYTIPVFAAAALSEPLIEDLPLGAQTSEWGQRSLRTILVGGPPMLGLQLLTGASRPTESSTGSHWKPFQDNNGVSGHSFMGAVPFISAAKMTDNFWLKGGLYVASTLPAISRVNDDHHYFSQAFLGWWLAYIAEGAVDRSHNPQTASHWHIVPQSTGLGVALEYRH